MDWKKRFLLVLLMSCAAELIGLGLPTMAQPPTAWVARYNGLGNSRLVVDAAGSVYVAGPSGTIKYDAAGNPLWVARSGVSVNAIAVDSDGNVYVTGSSNGGPDLSTEYATVKYDANGNQIWVARYNGPSSGRFATDIATALAVDDRGNVYVTGQSVRLGRFYDFATIKYDADGNEIWVSRFAGQSDGGTQNSATALALDGAGNVYVVGYAFGRQLSHFVAYDYAVLKYDAEGNERWVRRYNRTLNGNDEAHALALDRAGNLYVTGRSSVTPGGPGDYDFATIKYDTDGDELWVRRYDGPANGSDGASALALDDRGNAHVTGYSSPFRTGFIYDYATVKYDAEGNQIWVARYDGPANGSDSAAALALDRAGNVYVTGSSAGPGGRFTDNDYATVKYDADGNERWVARHDGPNNGNDRARALALDAAGNVYVTGSSGPNSPSTGVGDYMTVKYAAMPNLRLTVTDSQRTDDGIQLTLRLDNTGDADAAQVQLTSATLAQQEAAGLPQNLSTIQAGSSATVTLTIASDIPPGDAALLRAQGSYGGGAFSANQRVVVP